MTTSWAQFIQQLAPTTQATQPPLIFPITDLGVIQLQGADAQTFLQGQVTADVTQRPDKLAGVGALCSAKGRVQVNFIYFEQDSRYFLLVPNNQTQATLERLKKYAMFSKVTLEDQSENWHAFGYQNDPTNAPENGTIISLNLPGKTPIQLKLSTDEQALIHVFTQLQKTSASVCHASYWAYLQVQSGLAFVTPETENLFTPQMLNLEKLGGVSFNKGCYVGQEIIARTQHLGKLKRHLYQFHCNTQKIKIGDTIQAESSPNGGVVVQVVPINDTEALGLAVIEDRLLKETLTLNEQPLTNVDPFN